MNFRIALFIAFAIAFSGCESIHPAIQEAMIRTMERQRECDKTPVPMKWDIANREWVIEQRRALHKRAGCLPRSP